MHQLPQYEELASETQELYHKDKALFNNIARKTGKGLTFARSGLDGQTWVPLIEKAYAKLYGRYVNINGGHPGEAIQDLTGGTSTFIDTRVSECSSCCSENEHSNLLRSGHP